jgi:hypothetical protein
LGEHPVSDLWGMLKATKGFMLVRSGGRVVRVQVPAPAEASARPAGGDGWTLDLAAGWTAAPGERAGDMVLQQQP